MCRKKREVNWRHMGRNEILWAIVKLRTHIEPVFGQREVEISHDVTFDEDSAFGKV